MELQSHTVLADDVFSYVDFSLRNIRKLRDTKTTISIPANTESKSTMCAATMTDSGNGCFSDPTKLITKCREQLTHGIFIYADYYIIV